MAKRQHSAQGRGTASQATPPASKRRNRDAEVIQAAIKVFWKRGYPAASVQEVADEVGVLKGSLYHYIESKEALLMRVLDEAHTQSVELIKEIESSNAPPLVRLRTYFQRHVKWYLDNVEHASVFFHDWRFVTGEYLEVVKSRRDSYERFIRNMIEDAQRGGDIDPSISSKYALLFILGAVNAVPDWYRRTGRDSADEIASIYADLTIGTLTGTAASLPSPVSPLITTRSAARRSAQRG
jgi:TetR/AcrR family transcriptional regulator, cholesterol catabolism regulator